MNVKYQELLPTDFNASSRVWIYQSNRLFSNSETLVLENMLKQFVQTWDTHGLSVKGFAKLLFGQFVILIADESASKVSGCSTDSSVRLIKHIESHFKVNMFDRQMLAFYINQEVRLIPMSGLKEALENGLVNASTLYFNNTVSTKAALENDWLIAIKNSWLSERFVLPGKFDSNDAAEVAHLVERQLPKL